MEEMQGSPMKLLFLVYVTNPSRPRGLPDTTAWESAKHNIKKSQQKQKLQFDRKTQKMKFKVGDRSRVMVYSHLKILVNIGSLPWPLSNTGTEDK